MAMKIKAGERGTSTASQWLARFFSQAAPETEFEGQDSQDSQQMGRHFCMLCTKEASAGGGHTGSKGVTTKLRLSPKPRAFIAVDSGMTGSAAPATHGGASLCGASPKHLWQLGGARRRNTREGK